MSRPIGKSPVRPLNQVFLPTVMVWYNMTIETAVPDNLLVRYTVSWLTFTAAWTASFAGISPAEEATATPREISFNRDIRPILSGKCFKCHGPDEETRRAKLRLDRREDAVREREDGAAIRPGRPDESELVRRIHAEDPDVLMPPPESNKTLTERERAFLEAWIAQGAVYEEHWAFVPPVKSDPPPVRLSSWPRREIDAFILARLEAAGLSPSPEADPYTLVRRVYLDLIGLPPTPEEARAFVEDPSPDAYTRLVDRLLDSPRYGERWARRWLDLARYADTNGYEKDRHRDIWPYRDWVIRALNADMPFDEFTIAQLAGDLMPGDDVDRLIATGFHRNTMLNEEGGIDPLEFRFHAMTDRVATTGTTWLGLTIGCAQCHTHKYDPITHHDYYRFMAFLNNADEPELALPSPDGKAEWRRRQAEADRLTKTLADHWPIEQELWEPMRVVSAQTDSGQPAETLDDGSLLFAEPAPERDAYTIVLKTTQTNVAQLRLDALTHDRLPSRGPGRTPHGNFVLTDVKIMAAPITNPASARKVALASARAEVHQPKFPPEHAIDDDPRSGWAVHDPERPLNEDRSIVFDFAEPVASEGGTRFTVTLAQRYGGRHAIGRVLFRVPTVSVPQSESELTSRRHEALDAAFQRWLQEERGRTVRWMPIAPVEATANLPHLAVQDDHSVFASGDTTKQDTYRLKYDLPPGSITAFRLEALPDERLPEGGPGMTYYEGERGDFFLTEFSMTARGEAVTFGEASHSYAKNRFGSHEVSAQLALDGDKQTGWSVSGRVGERHVAVFVPESPVSGGREIELTMMFGRHFASSLGRFRLSVTQDSGPVRARDLPAATEALLAVPDGELTDAQRAALRDTFLLQAPEVREHAQRIRRLRQPPDAATTLIMRERPPENPRPTFVHHRGEFLQPKDPVQPGVPKIFEREDDSGPDNRLEFARWLVSRDNPLTARVTVNRQWAAFFGQGLVRTLQDFGMQGELPSHPRLLDWLAVDFMDQGWSLKKLHRQIVLSATYRQSSRVSPERRHRDPENRLLARGPRFRLEAEILRDQLLRASGLLTEKMFGPPVRPPQPEGVTEVAYGNPSWNASTGADRYRRSIYTYLKRTAPFAMFTTFDAPSGEACVARRDVSNSPLQALTLLNDVMLVEAAQALGRRVAEQCDTDKEGGVRLAFQRVLVRPPTDEEVDMLTAFVRDQRARFQAGELDVRAVAGTDEENASDAVARATWTALARALFNLDETVTKE